MPRKPFPFTEIPQNLQSRILKCLDIRESLILLQINKSRRKEILIIGPFKRKLGKVRFSFVSFEVRKFMADCVGMELCIEDFNFFIRRHHLTILGNGRTEKTIFVPKPFSLFGPTIKSCETFQIDLCLDFDKENVNRFMRHHFTDQHFLPELRYVSNLELTLSGFSIEAARLLLKDLHLTVTDACIFDPRCGKEEDFDEQYEFWEELIERIEAADCQVIGSNLGLGLAAIVLNEKAKARLFLGNDIDGHEFHINVDKFFDDSDGLEKGKAMLLHMVQDKSIDPQFSEQLFEYFVVNEDAKRLDPDDSELEPLRDYFRKDYVRINCWDFLLSALAIDSRVPKDYLRNFDRIFEKVAYLKENLGDSLIFYMLTIEDLDEKSYIVQLFAYRTCSA